MSSNPTPSRKRPRRSTGQILLLTTGAIVALCICFLGVTALRGLSPAAQQDAANSRATATVQSGQQVDAGATVVAQIKADATQTALAALTPGPSATPQSYSAGNMHRDREAAVSSNTIRITRTQGGGVLYLTPTWARN